MLSEFNRSLMLIADKALLIDNFTSKIKQLFLVDDLFVFLLDDNTGRYKLQNRCGQHAVTFYSKERLIQWLAVNDKELVISEHKDVVAYLLPEEQEKIAQLKAELVYPLKVMNHISGAIFLGKKGDGSAFGKEEIEVTSEAGKGICVRILLPQTNV
jgi:hypothetical protein